MTMRLLLFVGALALAPRASAQDDVYTPDLRSAEAALLKGQIARARAGFEDILQAGEEEAEPDRPAATTLRRCRLGLAELDLMQGRYDQVLAALAKLDEAADRDVLVLRARALARRGRYAESAREYATVVDADPTDMEARHGLALQLRAHGKHAESRAVLLAAIEVTRAARPTDGRDLAYLGQCRVELGGRDNVEAASELFVAAQRAAPERPEALTFLGQLKFDVYRESSGFRSGEADLKKVLDQNGEREDALIALYRIRRANFQLDPSRTEDYLRRAMALNPHSVPALTEQAILLLDDRRFEDGAAILERALGIDPNDKWTLAHRTAAAVLMGKREVEAELRARIAAIDAAYADVDRIVGDHLVALYRFADSIPLYERALAAAPDSIPALDGLAKALIYTGRGQDARQRLEHAKALQPGFVNPWRHNALTIQELIEKEYKMVEKGGFRFFFHRDDHGVLAEYLVPLHLEAMDKLGLKYDYTPTGTVRVETLHDWDDFSVRTIGFRGFTALGACFGSFVTLVSPGDRDVRRQDFMWSATVWHEYAHVLTLALSKHRVPRWLTEGFSVHEESSRNRTWERGMDRQLFDYWHGDRIYPVRELNRAFRGPDILFGYYQGGLIVDFLTEKLGFPKVVEMLKLYGDDLPQEEIFKRIYGSGSERFDREFKQWCWDTRLASLQMVPGVTDDRLQVLVGRAGIGQASRQELVQIGWGYAARGADADAARFVRLALLDQADYGPALLLHAELMRRRGAREDATATFARGFAAGADDFDSRIRYAELLEAAGDLDGAMQQYQFAKRCWPRCTEQAVAPSLRIARVLRKLDREVDAMAELAGYCALTGRALQPRLDLAAFHARQGDKGLEIKFLEEALQIDPFMRDLHVRLGDAYVATDRAGEAIVEYRVALAVPTSLDRAWLDSQDGPPAEDAPEMREARGSIWLKLAKIHRQQVDYEHAFQALDEVGRVAPGTDLAAEAERLRREWK